jgi:hypothetical protein
MVFGQIFHVNISIHVAHPEQRPLEQISLVKGRRLSRIRQDGSHVERKYTDETVISVP